jgi:hypothetical protein
MTFYRRIGLAVGWGLSLVIVALWSSAHARGPDTPTLFSGVDLGFRLEQTKGNLREGTLVVRIDGQWVEVQLSRKMGPVK